MEVEKRNHKSEYFLRRNGCLRFKLETAFFFLLLKTKKKTQNDSDEQDFSKLVSNLWSTIFLKNEDKTMSRESIEKRKRVLIIVTDF